MSSVWYVQCKPFVETERHDKKLVNNFQMACLYDNLFGMGWKSSKMREYEGKQINDTLAEEYRKAKKEDDGKLSGKFTASQNCYLRMKEGDVVLTRFCEEYYLGIIKTRPVVSSYERFSWSATVDEWRTLGFRDRLPHHISGLLSGKSMTGTVAEIKGMAAYTLLNLAGIKSDKVKLTVDNFVMSLGDADLEDLVAEYMIKKNPGYIFLPSSCKKGTPGIEFVMYNPVNGDQICCQTKVNAGIDLADYYNSGYRKYKAIYLFSGIEKYSSSDCEAANICYIDKAELFESFKQNGYFRKEIEAYFDFET